MASAIRLVDLLPARIRDDDLVLQLLQSFDQLLEPVLLQIDRLEELADPLAAPDAMVDWLCLWLGWELPKTWPDIDRKRLLLQQSGFLLRSRGTARGLEALVRVLGGPDVADVRVEDAGWVRTRLGQDPPAGAVRPGQARVTVWGEAQAWSEARRAELERILGGEVPPDVVLAVNYRLPA